MWALCSQRRQNKSLEHIGQTEKLIDVDIWKMANIGRYIGIGDISSTTSIYALRPDVGPAVI